MHRDDSGIFSLVIKCVGITNPSIQNFAIRITVPKCWRKLKVFFNKFIKDVSSLLMTSLRAIVICQKYILLRKSCDIVPNPSFCTFT